MVPPAPRRPIAAAGAGTVTAAMRRPRVDPREVASRLAPAVQWPGAVDMQSRTPDFDAWLISWPKDGKVELHDHGASTGAVSVISGALVEAVPWRDDNGRLTLIRHELRAGATLGFGADHVHDVTNESDEHALSLHVYSPALTSMTFYELTEDHLVVRDVAWSADGSGEFGQGKEREPVGTGATAVR
jgi:hypothetical protein